MPATPLKAPQPEPTRRWVQALVLGAVLLGLFIASLALDLEGGVDSVRTWIGHLGAWGPLVFIGLYIAATVLMVPGAIPTLMSGALFGGLWGTVYASIGSTIGAGLAFLIARYVARDSVGTWLKGKPGLKRIDRLTLSHGALIVCVTRMVPLIPFNVVNYAFGLTHVKFWRYVAVSWICMLPGTFVYAAGTDVLLLSGDVPWLLLGALAGAVVLMVLLGRRAANRLRRVEAGNDTDAPTVLDEAIPNEAVLEEGV